MNLGDSLPPVEEATITATPTPSETPQPPSAPEATQTPIPALATDTPVPTETIPVPDTAAPTQTETATPSASPTIADIPNTFTWSVEINVPVPPTVMDSLGGPEGVENTIEQQLNAGLAGEEVAHQVEPSGEIDGLPAYKVSMQGEGGLDQLKKAVFGDLSNQVNLLGGPIDLTIKGFTQNGQAMPLILETNPSTGFVWDITGLDPQYLVNTSESQSSPVVASVGSPLRQTFDLRQVGDGQTVISATYHRPWEETAATRKVTIETGYLPGELDLTDPSVETPAEPDTSAVASVPEEVIVGAVPASYDWRSSGKVTSVKNQGSCGSCWAFATVGVMEAAILRQTGENVDLSEQFLVSCNQEGYSCSGGWYAHDYHISKLGKNQSQIGAVLESDLPYSATNGSCTQAFNHPYRGSSWAYVPSYPNPSVDAIKQAIYDHGPVAVAVCAGSAFSAYSGGVFATDEKNSACSGGINHAVVLTGWDDATQSWIMKNSWGPYWGESGYMRIKWGTSNIGYGASYMVYSNGPTPTPSPTIVPTWNDDITLAIDLPLNATTYTTTLNTTTATTEWDDPSFACVNGQKYHSVWYRFVPSTDGTITLSTTGSNYDTVLGLWRGSRGSLTAVGCNDDYNGVATSYLTKQITAGSTYYIEVASYYSTAGNLSLSGTYAVPATPTPTVPTATPTFTASPTPTVPTATPTFTFTPTFTATVTPIVPGTYDDAGGAVIYHGNWTQSNLSGPFHDTIHYTTRPGDNATLTFRGREVSLIFTKYTNRGSASISIDGAPAATINAYASRILWQQSWTSGALADGSHTLTVTYTGGQSMFDIDAIIVRESPGALPSPTPTLSPTLTPTATQTIDPSLAPTQTSTRIPVSAGTFDDNSRAVAYGGRWSRMVASGAFNGTLHYTNIPGNNASLTFTGGEVSLLYTKFTNRGSAAIAIDGVQVATLNAYSSQIRWRQRWDSGALTPGAHTITVTYLGGQAIFDIDAFIVRALPGVEPADAQNTPLPPPSATPLPTATQAAPPASDPGDSAPAPQEVVNDVETETPSQQADGIDPTAESEATENPVAPVIVADGPSVFTSTPLPAGNQPAPAQPIAAASPTAPVPTAARVLADLGAYDDTSPAVQYNGSWSPMTIAGLYNDSLHYSTHPGDSATLTFSGRGVGLMYTKYSNRGVAVIAIDGVQAAVLNAYSPTVQWRQRWDSLPLEPGTHTITVTYIGGQSMFDVDAFVIRN